MITRDNDDYQYSDNTFV